jgi:DNA-binding MarR family transcriptional regulator
MVSTKNSDADVSELIASIGLLIRRVRSEAPSEAHELSWTQKTVLIRLESEGATTVAELARAQNIKPQSMGTAVAHLESAGLVVKKTHPTDGRRMLVALSPKGISLRKNLRDSKHHWLAQAVAKLNKRERSLLFSSGKIIKRLAEL